MLLQLRKVSELDRPSVRPKEDERNSFLEQIKNKVICKIEVLYLLIIVGGNGF